MSAAASAKHENFVMSSIDTQRARGGARPRQTARSTLRMYVVHLGPRLKAPRKAAGLIGPAHRPFHR